METYGLIFAFLFALGISSVLAVITLAFRRCRRFVLSVGITPPVSVLLFFTTRWLALDYTPGCEAKVADFQRCPSISASVVGWIALAVGIVIVAVSGYGAQRVVQAAIGIWFDTEPIKLFKEE